MLLLSKSARHAWGFSSLALPTRPCPALPKPPRAAHRTALGRVRRTTLPGEGRPLAGWPPQGLAND